MSLLEILVSTGFYKSFTPKIFKTSKILAKILKILRNLRNLYEDYTYVPILISLFPQICFLDLIGSFCHPGSCN